MTETLTRETETARTIIDTMPTPAFWDGLHIVAPSGKYLLNADLRGMYLDHALSEKGFERNIENCTTREREWLAGLIFNAAADTARTEWKARAEAKAAEYQAAVDRATEAERIEREATMAHRAACDDLLAKARFKKQAVTLTAETPVTIDAPTFAGIAVHREYVRNESYRKKAPFVLTHVRSGLILVLGMPTLQMAKVAAVRLAAAGDMSRDAKEIAKDKAVVAVAAAIRQLKDPYARVY